MDPRERFSAGAEIYHRYRPGYPDGLLDWIVAATGLRAGGRVADLGCGTGIFTRLLAGRGLAVVGVDPNAEMLRMAREVGGGPAYVTGDSAQTGLADASVDLVTAAQAFHWFPLEATLAELDRILVPGGWTCALWNVRTSSPFNEEYERLLRTYSSDYATDTRLSDLDDPRVGLGAIPGTVAAEVPFADALAWDGVIGRVRSASYVIHGVADRSAFERRVREAYERHARADGKLVWAMNAVAIAWPRQR